MYHNTCCIVLIMGGVVYTCLCSGIVTQTVTRLITVKHTSTYTLLIMLKEAFGSNIWFRSSNIIYHSGYQDFGPLITKSGERRRRRLYSPDYMSTRFPNDVFDLASPVDL